MPWTRSQPTLTARVTNEDLRGMVERRDGVTYVRIRVETDDGQGGNEPIELEKALSDTSLSGAQQTTFQQLWLALRDDFLPDMGFTEVA